jgi:protein-L-isoaspartate(D-aspartate) O-methyltransferase
MTLTEGPGALLASRRSMVPSRGIPRWAAALLAALIAAGSACNGRGGREGNGGASLSEGDHPEDDHAEEWYVREREKLVDELATPLHEAPITDPRVLDALRKVPRHEFVPRRYRDQSYENSPLPIGDGQTISQPYIVALMTQLLDLDGTEKVLEIGTGSGYQAAVLGELSAELYTVEIRPALLETAKKTLEDLRARGALSQRKLVAVVGDGWKGYPPGAPYDAIMVTAAPDHVPPALVEQLKPGGRMVIPVGDFFQELLLIRKREDGSLSEETIVAVRFVPLVGGEGEQR